MGLLARYPPGGAECLRFDNGRNPGGNTGARATARAELDEERKGRSRCLSWLRKALSSLPELNPPPSQHCRRQRAFSNMSASVDGGNTTNNIIVERR